MSMTAACSLGWLHWRKALESATGTEGMHRDLIVTRIFAQKNWSERCMADLREELEAQIAGVKATTAARQNVGVIRELGDGVARVEGLRDAMLNEILDLGHGITGPPLHRAEP